MPSNLVRHADLPAVSLYMQTLACFALMTASSLGPERKEVIEAGISYVAILSIIGGFLSTMKPLSMQNGLHWARYVHHPFSLACKHLFALGSVSDAVEVVLDEGECKFLTKEE